MEYLNDLFSDALKEEQYEHTINIMKLIFAELEKQFEKKEDEESVSLLWRKENLLLQLYWEHAQPTFIKFDLFFCEENKEDKKITTTYVSDINKKNIENNTKDIEKTITLLFKTYIKYKNKYV